LARRKSASHYGSELVTLRHCREALREFVTRPASVAGGRPEHVERPKGFVAPKQPCERELVPGLTLLSATNLSVNQRVLGRAVNNR
jgi:hypothetical protein